ncbi:hypothetical protein [Allocoleopsis franciscana]|uniref:hypothetical protein n=1 Tax=Allocoleopsis franciscana TaxID=2886352 RepID=UPI000300B25F|nr:hypothetical protein [Allocoleopsis franciscana]
MWREFAVLNKAVRLTGAILLHSPVALWSRGYRYSIRLGRAIQSPLTLRTKLLSGRFRQTLT